MFKGNKLICSICGKEKNILKIVSKKRKGGKNNA